MKNWFSAVGIMVVVLVSGCAIKMADLTVLSIRSNNIPAKSVGSRVTGEHCVFSWIGVNWLGNDPDMKMALDDAMEKAGPEYDALVSVSLVRTNGLWKNCYRVTGTAINTKTANAAAGQR